MKYILFFDKISKKDTFLVGGKNSSLGEMIKNLKIHIPFGFAITSKAYKKFIKENLLMPKIKDLLKKNKGFLIQDLFKNTFLPKDVEKEIILAHKILKKKYDENLDLAVRSSATAEDAPKASFAGQLESFLNIQEEKDLLKYTIKCFSSLFTKRAIAYSIEKKIDLSKIAISVGVQKMVRSDKSSSGVIFTLDTETGFRNVIKITSSFGLCENIVKGKIIPDEFILFKNFLSTKFDPILEKYLGKKDFKLVYSKKFTKNVKTSLKEKKIFSLSDLEAIKLAKWAKKIEDHYKVPMDIEWAKDGIENKLYIVQARPETIHSQKSLNLFQNFRLKEKAKPILTGIAIGDRIANGKVQIIKSVKQIEKFKKGNILVTQNTTPDWVPIMKMASGIITDFGGRTSHAAIVSRELMIPAIVGTKNGSTILKNGQKITIDCSSSNKGYIYNNFLKYEYSKTTFKKFPKTPIMINISSPDSAFKWWNLPISGIGLARIEFIISNTIKIHPLALIDFHKIKDIQTRKKIKSLTQNYKNKKQYFIDLLSKNISKIAASQYPKKAIIRLSDFKTNEYANLIGGKYFEEIEENPMIGFRGASRYYHPKYIKAFKLECLSIKKAIDHFGFSNISIMIPFCRTLKEADNVIKILKKNGLKQTKTFKIYMTVEIPSNIILAKQFAEKFDGFSIGSNDLTQLTLGVDRDSYLLEKTFDPKNEAVKESIKEVIKKVHLKNKKIGICGQAPSDYPEFAKFLIKEKIDYISLNPDSVAKTIKKLSN